jgi:hypothetical protein
VGVVATVTRGLAFTLTVLLGVLGTLFVAGEALADPGGLAGGLLTALWVLPTVALSVLAGTLLVATVGNVVMHQTGQLPPGPGLGASAGVVALPLLVVGGLFLLAEPSPDRTPVGAPHRVSESPTAADRPASSRATGTRNGEQDT